MVYILMLGVESGKEVVDAFLRLFMKSCLQNFTLKSCFEDTTSKFYIEIMSSKHNFRILH